jgi:spore coat protein A
LKSLPQITRRTFVASTGLALAGFSLRTASAETKANSQSPILDASTLAPFVDPMPVPAMAQPAGTRPDPDNPKQKIPFYRLPIAETPIKLHRDLPPTRMWTIGGSFPGLTLESPIAQGMIVEWQNRLPSRHLFTIDHSLHGAEKTIPDVRAVIHLHGGRTPAASDGYPEEWTLPGRSQTCHYPSLQHAATLFYHDHTMGINRLNTYSGMLGFCILRDAREDDLRLPTGPHDIPLLICDRLLRADGRLDYPVSEKPGEVWVPEVFGDAILANGKLLPHLDVEPTLYRFRLMNASNGRFFRFSLRNQAPFHAIASDQGLLAAPTPLKRITLAPAERADILIDFSSLAGQRTELISDSFSILQFRIASSNNKAVILSEARGINNEVVVLSGASAKSRDLLLSAPQSRSNSAIPTALHPVERIPESAAVRTRRLTLDERMDMIQHSMGMLLNNTPWHAPITEKPVLHTTEIWELVNLTDDSHPIHLHLVRFQILDRRPFDTFEYQSKGTLHFFGPARPPAPEEMGWKDTVRADPAMVTRIIIPFDGYPGRYVWHCHILEHEDNEMMRPFEVLPVSS